MPVGTLVTEPVPVPVFVMVNKWLGVVSNVAVTVVLDVPTRIEQVPVPEHPPPLQPVKLDPEAGVAVRLTVLPLSKVAEHVAPQLMPAGALTTEPEPVPAGVTVMSNLAGTKLAVTLCAALIVTVHVPAPLHPLPLQPAKTVLAGADAVSVTVAPSR